MFDLISTFVLDLRTSTDVSFWPLPLHQLGRQSLVVSRQSTIVSQLPQELGNLLSLLVAAPLNLFEFNSYLHLISELFFSLFGVYFVCSFLIKVKFITA